MARARLAMRPDWPERATEPLVTEPVKKTRRFFYCSTPTAVEFGDDQDVGLHCSGRTWRLFALVDPHASEEN